MQARWKSTASAIKLPSSRCCMAASAAHSAEMKWTRSGMSSSETYPVQLATGTRETASAQLGRDVDMCHAVQ